MFIHRWYLAQSTSVRICKHCNKDYELTSVSHPSHWVVRTSDVQKRIRTSGVHLLLNCSCFSLVRQATVLRESLEPLWRETNGIPRSCPCSSITWLNRSRPCKLPDLESLGSQPRVIVNWKECVMFDVIIFRGSKFRISFPARYVFEGSNLKVRVTICCFAKSCLRGSQFLWRETLNLYSKTCSSTWNPHWTSEHRILIFEQFRKP